MNRIEVVLPKMGESIIEATILKWNKKEGDFISADEVLLEIATDKVDSDVVSPGDGIISKIFYKENEVVKIGSILAVLNDAESNEVTSPPSTDKSNEIIDLELKNEKTSDLNDLQPNIPFVPSHKDFERPENSNTKLSQEHKKLDIEDKKYLSPLVRSIAKKEKISEEELVVLQNKNGDSRIKKSDILSYLSQRDKQSIDNSTPDETPKEVEKLVPEEKTIPDEKPIYSTSIPKINAVDESVLNEGDEVIELDRMRKLIAQHMVMSKQVSPHVTSFVEVDVTDIVKWRDENKDSFFKSSGEKLTYTPIFIEAVVKAIKDFPKINARLDGDNLIIKKDINIGMATALPSGNLIVPVIKKANHLSLNGLTAKVNELASKARNNKLNPEEIQEGTFTITNVGTFGNLTGTPIINQPQLAILAVGQIKKKPVVLETPQGDVIGIRNMMLMSLSYDHRIIDGFLGGSFLKRVADYMERFTGE